MLLYCDIILFWYSLVIHHIPYVGEMLTLVGSWGKIVLMSRGRVMLSRDAYL